MKYIVDLDALKECLTLIESFKVNGHQAVYLNNVKLFIDKFPKEEYEEKVKNNVNFRLPSLDLPPDKFSEELKSQMSNKKDNGVHR